MYGTMTLLHSAAALLAVCLVLAAPGDARAQNILTAIESAKEALKSHKAAEANASSDKAPASNFGVMVWAPGDIDTPRSVKVGSNVFVVAACAVFYSGSTPYTLLATTDGWSIYSPTSMFAAALQSACIVRSAIAVNVTSVSGSNFGWDVIAF